MLKILLLFVVVGEAVLLIAQAIAGIFRLFRRKKASGAAHTVDWYGNCEGCGKPSGLHSLAGKRYCAVCYARKKTGKDIANDT